MTLPNSPDGRAPAGITPDTSLTAEDLAIGAQAVARWARETPDAVAVVEGVMSWSYRALATHIVQAGVMLRRGGLRPGMVIGIQSELQYSQLVLILATEVTGASHLSLAPSDLTGDDELLKRCDMLCIETTTESTARHPCAIELSSRLLDDISTIEVTASALQALDAGYSPDSILRIGPTSGTTGSKKFTYDTPRSVATKHRSVEYTLKYDRRRYHFVAAYRFSVQNTYADTILALRQGVSATYCNENDFLTTIRMLPACHSFLLVGDAFRLISEISASSQRADTCSIRIFGGPVSVPLRAAIRKNLTNDVIGLYGSTEAGSVAIMEETDIGTLLPDVSAMIVDDDGTPKAAGEPGIIVVRLPHMNTHYLWDDEQTARSFANGWFRTSDLGIIPEPGKLIVLGRADEMIIVGGLKIAPYLIEEQIKALPDVTGAVMTGLENSLGIGELHVFIERSDPALDERIGAGLVALLRRHVVTFAAHYTARFPRTLTGKVRRNVLKARLMSGE
ncbi:MAG: long-chain fatty acid--CoA ligase [Acetobacteraceae bacterium]|nr:long-chain fatty acid--CoA ligase [Acetobacteraceae bacterium]